MRTLFESNAIRKTECKEDEAEFWKNLISKFLKPDLHAFGMEAETKEKLVELRNKWLVLMVICNTLWLIFLSTIARKAKLTVMGANPIGLLFLIIFGLLLFIQFVAMIVHRGITLCHYIAMLDNKEKKSGDQEMQPLLQRRGYDPI
uniref:Uncharacterized protein n=1 Tax=Biomphalaria glabrata TaxID=6526 RepID=A0A2C9M4T4_BIOGL